MGINNAPVDKMIRPADIKNKVKVKVLKPFMFNGKFLQEGEDAEMVEDRAVNHMRAGDVARDDQLISKIKERRMKAAEAAIKDAQGDW